MGGGRMQVKELLLPFGHLKAFNLVMDKNTGNSKVRGGTALGQVHVQHANLSGDMSPSGKSWHPAAGSLASSMSPAFRS